MNVLLITKHFKSMAFICFAGLFLAACQPSTLVTMEIKGFSENGAETSVPALVFDYSETAAEIPADELALRLDKVEYLFNGVVINDLITEGEQNATLKADEASQSRLDTIMVDGINYITVTQIVQGLVGDLPTTIATAEFIYTNSAPRIVVTGVQLNADDTVTMRGYSQTELELDYLSINAAAADLFSASFNNQRFDVTVDEANEYVLAAQAKGQAEGISKTYVKRGAYIDKAIRVAVNSNIINSQDLRDYTNAISLTNTVIPSTLTNELNPLETIEILGNQMEIGFTEFESLVGEKYPATYNEFTERTHYPSLFKLSKGLEIKSLNFVGATDSTATITLGLVLRGLNIYVTAKNVPLSPDDINVDAALDELELTMTVVMSVNDAGRAVFSVPSEDLTGIITGPHVETNVLFTLLDGIIEGILEGEGLRDQLGGILGPIIENFLNNEDALGGVELGAMLDIPNLMAADIRASNFSTADGNLGIDLQTAFKGDKIRVEALGSVSNAGLKDYTNTHDRTGTVTVERDTVTEFNEETGRYEFKPGDTTYTVVRDFDDDSLILPLELPSAQFGSIDYAIDNKTVKSDTSSTRNIGVTVSSNMINQAMLAIHESGLTNLRLYSTNNTITVVQAGAAEPSGLKAGDLRINARLATPIEVLFSGDAETLLTDILVPSFILTVDTLHASGSWGGLLSASVLATIGADLGLTTQGVFSFAMDPEDFDFKILEAKLLNYALGRATEGVVNLVLGMVKPQLAIFLEDVVKFDADLEEAFGISDLGLSNIKLSAAGSEFNDLEVGFNIDIGKLIKQAAATPTVAE